MVPLFHGSVDGWFPAQSPLSHLQLIIPSLSFFPGSSPLIWLSPFSFFHCFNASCQIECLWVTTLSFLDYRPLEGFFLPCIAASALFPLQLPLFYPILPLFFFFSLDRRPVFPISLLSQTLTSISLSVGLMIGKRHSWYSRKVHMLLNLFSVFLHRLERVGKGPHLLRDSYDCRSQGYQPCFEGTGLVDSPVCTWCSHQVAMGSLCLLCVSE